MSVKSVLFVCLGNICRSPLAEGIFRHQVKERGIAEKFKIDSCGTGQWHVGNAPHPESVAVAKKNGVSLAGQKSRQLDDQDYFEFDYIVAMDESNLRDIQERKVGGESEIFCLRKYDPEGGGLSVPDPYYEGGFDGVYNMIERSLERFLGSIS